MFKGPKGIKGDKGLKGIKGEIGNIPLHNWDNTKIKFQKSIDNNNNPVWGNM